MKGLTVKDMLTLLATCAPTARILVETNSTQKNTPYDDSCEVIDLIEYRTYEIEGETANPEVVFHFEIPDWKARGLEVVLQNGIFVQTVYR